MRGARSTVDSWRRCACRAHRSGGRRGPEAIGSARSGECPPLCASLDALPIEIEPVSTSRAWGPALALADQHGLSVYDATYLELALRLGLPLATLDRALGAAARAAGVDTPASA